MFNETLTYSADGLNFKSQFYVPDGARNRAAVLVFPEAFGLSENAITRAKRLAEMGFAALACDLHGDAKREEDLQKAVVLLQPMFDDPTKTRARASAALAALSARPEVDASRIASIGYSFGGLMSLELARMGAAIKAVVGFHSGLDTKMPAPADSKPKPRILVCIGAADPMIPPEQRAAFEAEMNAAQADWQMHIYGNVVHSFTSHDAAKRNLPDAIRYDEKADAMSWAALTQLFNEALA